MSIYFVFEVFKRKSGNNLTEITDFEVITMFSFNLDCFKISSLSLDLI